jgi:hypothetical protein
MSWFEEEVKMPIGGSVPRVPWSVRSSEGFVVTEGCDKSDRTPYDYFMLMFPYEHLGVMCRLSNKQLSIYNFTRTTIGQILRSLEFLFS